MNITAGQKNRIFSNLLIFSIIVILLGFVVHYYRTCLFNKVDHSFEPASASRGCTFDIHPRGGVSDSWDKYDVPVNGQVCTLKGCTYEGDLSNYSKYKISSWTLRVNIHDDCFINNAWCGTVEIHQNSSEGEKVQTLDLREMNRDKITLKYIPVGQDILIELHEGDYIIYHLNTAAMEAPVTSFNKTPGETSIGFIFYYLKSKDLDFSDFYGTYRYSRSYSQGIEPKLLLAAFIIWLILVIVRCSISYAYKKAQKETEKRIAIQRMHELEEYNKEIRETNRQLEESFDMIRAVSDLYYLLYSVDLEEDDFTEVKSEERISSCLKSITRASDAFKSLPEQLFVAEDLEKVNEFFNMDLWQQKLKDIDTVTGDFRAINKGWVRCNLIVAKRDDIGRALLVLCAIQDVDKIVKEEQEQKARLEEANRIMKSYNEALNADVETKTAHIKEIQRKVVRGLANVIGNRDMDTVGHVNRTSEVIQIIVEEYRKQFKNTISNQLAYDIVRAAPMHDLGKIYIDTVILCKPDRFTESEYEKMKMHSSYSGDIVNFVLKDVEEPHFVEVAFNVARFHHERWDGKGYPDKLAGEQIPLEARLMALADVYDALVSKRCYKEPMSFEQAFSIMCEGMGTQFDPSLKSVFLAVRENLETYYQKSNEKLR